MPLVACEPGEDPDAKEPKSTGKATGGSNHEDVGDGEAGCIGAAQASAQWERLEEEVLELVNEVRERGAKCGSKGSFEAAPALTLDKKLRCAARRHSKDMVERTFFDHTNPDGETPMKRMNEAGYKGRYAGENIAAGQASSQEVMKGWMKSDGHCANIMNPRYQHLGVGYLDAPESKYRHYWTQNFGAK